MKKIKFDRHARRRMKWRNISEEEVISVLTQPDNKEPTIKDRFNAYKEIGGRKIKVTYMESVEEIYVITALTKK
jgi:hypothetical protein